MALKEPEYTFNKVNERITEFKGYNARGVRDDGEMKDMEGLTSDEYPMLSSAKAPRTYSNVPYNHPKQMLSKTHTDENGELVEVLYVIAQDSDGSYRCYANGSQIAELEFSENTQMVPINDKICFFPEKTWYSVKSGLIGDISATTGLLSGTTVTVEDDLQNNSMSSVIKVADAVALKDKFSVGDVVTIKSASAEPKMLLLKKNSQYYNSYHFFAGNPEAKTGNGKGHNLPTGAWSPEGGKVSGHSLYYDQTNDRSYYIANLHDTGDSWVDVIKLPFPVDPMSIFITVYFTKEYGGNAIIYNPKNGVESGLGITTTLSADKRTLTISANNYTNNPITFYNVFAERADIRYLCTSVSSDGKRVTDNIYMSSVGFETDAEAEEWAELNCPKSTADIPNHLNAWTQICSKENSSSDIHFGGQAAFGKDYRYIVQYAEFTSTDKTNLSMLDNLYITFKESDAKPDSTSTFADGINGTTAVIQAITDKSITFPDNTFQSTTGEQVGGKSEVMNIEISRPSPELDYVIEWNNRLWGCSNSDNTIYASKLGDPTNWQWYQGTSLDSYFAEQGSNGKWTGVGKYSTHLLFFKEDCVHKVYGNFPSEYQIITQVCSGVKDGSSKSIVTMEDGVFYHSRRGIMGYSGGIPSLISAEFGKERYKNAVAGSDGSKYYVSLQDNQGAHHLFVFDSELGVWHRYGTQDVADFEYHSGELIYAETQFENSPLMVIDNYNTDYVSDWYAVFGPLDEYVENEKIYSVITLRYNLHDSKKLKVEMAIDDGDWEEIDEVIGSATTGHEIQFIPKRCDHFAIRLSGNGGCTIKSLTREFRVGSVQKENY